MLSVSGWSVLSISDHLVVVVPVFALPVSLYIDVPCPSPPWICLMFQLLSSILLFFIAFFTIGVRVFLFNIVWWSIGVLNLVMS